MATLQKQILDVRLLGLDEKANPRGAQPGTIVDGCNWMMVDDGRIEKRPGTTALPMLDTAGNTVASPRELSSLNDELVLGNARKWYGLNSITGQWIPRGFAAYERLHINQVIATPAPCNGVDSRLLVDSAQIGNYTLLGLSGGLYDGDYSASCYILVDSATGQIVTQYSNLLGWDWTMGTDGHTASPTFVGFIANTNNLFAIVWDNTTGFRSILGKAGILSDVINLTDANSYGLQTTGVPAAPYASVLVGDNVWLVAYQNASGYIAIRKVTRTSGTTFSISSPTLVTSASFTTYAQTLAWAYNLGDATATLAFCGQGDSDTTAVLRYSTITISSMAWTGVASTSPTGWATCRGLTGIMVSGTPYFFADIYLSATNHPPALRNVYSWAPAASPPAPVLVLQAAGLLSHAFTPPIGDTGEIGLGVAYLSSWQPSAFILRLRMAAGVVASMNIGAHLQNGNLAGKPMTTHLPNMAGGQIGLGVLNNPVSSGALGTVLVELAVLTQTTHASVSQPCQIADTLLLPGAALKAYDGAHITEAAFPLGPESIAASENNSGKPLYIGPANALVTASPTAGTMTIPVSGGTAIALFASGPIGTLLWPTGTLTVTVWAWITGGSGSYQFGFIGGETIQIARHASDGSDYIYAPTATLPPTQTLTGSVAKYVFTVPVSPQWTGSAPVPAVTDLLKLQLLCSGTSGATLHIAYGASQPSGITTLIPVIEPGTREYCACLAWTDSQGRTQRSQPCPAVSTTNVNGFPMNLTAYMVNITERDPLFNYDAAIPCAVIEIYRTLVNQPIFYRVATIPNTANGANVAYSDSTADATLDANEQLYTTGGVVENWPTIGANLVASHQGRAFVATADNLVFFTAYAQSGEGLAFAAEYQVETEHIPGALTALLSLDSNLAICTATNYAALSGVGPESTGLPAYDSPMLVGSGIGPTSQRACARTPTGIAMITAHGAQMFDRGLNLNYIGIHVDNDIPDGSSWYAATLHPGKNQVRFYADSLVTVYDWTISPPPGRQSQFYKWAYPDTVVATAIASGAIYQLVSGGTVYLADQGYSDAGTAYQEWVKLSVVSPAGIDSWSRLYAARFACDIVAGTSLQVVFTPEEGNLSTTDTNTIAGPLKHVICKPRYGKISSMVMWIGESAATTTAGITLDAIGLLVGNKGGVGRLPAASRMVRS